MAGQDLNSGIPMPIPDIPCQELLKESNCCVSSWLRKQSFRNKVKIFSWPQIFVVLCGGCVYYFRNETASKPSGSFSLYGYNSIMRAGEILTSEAPWAFKLVHTHKEYKTYLFSASSEVEMKDWMKKMKKELKKANSQNIRGVGDGQDDMDDISQTYQDIETKIYEDPKSFVIPKNYGNRRNDDYTDDDDIYRMRDPVPPPVPPRQKSEGAMHALTPSDAVAQELQAKLAVNKKTDKGKTKKSALTRGSPDGSSIRKPTTEVYQDASSVADKEEEVEDDPEKYWAAIYFTGTAKDKASDIIRAIAEDGVYLVRDSQEGNDKVLVVFAEGMPKKFKITYKNEKYFLASNVVVACETIEELMLHYYTESLPKYTCGLTMPFKLHPKYKPSME